MYVYILTLAYYYFAILASILALFATIIVVTIGITLAMHCR